MPSVKDVVVIPVLCDEAGEIPRAYVTLQPNHSHVTEAHIIDYVHERVAPHKKLRGGIIFSDTIPRSASGKLLRRVQIEMDRAANPKK
jgi:acyl-coenzyme A synthetase/AMP-(fatty) acid ligase